MADKIYDLDEVRTGIRAIVAEVGPEHHYISPDGEGCVYISNSGEPSCLIGRYLHSIGASDDLLRQCDTRGSVSVVLDVLSAAGFKFTDAATDWMRLVQRKQDVGDPWGEALEYADRELNAHV